MNVGRIHFGGDLVSGILRLVLNDLQRKFDGELLDLTVLDLLASRYELDQILAPTWNRLLQPDTTYRFLVAVAKGYQIECTSILTHFESRIERIVRDYLDSHSQGRSREDLIAILDRFIVKVDNGDLAAEEYHIELDERALESPYDPDYESEQYYEHQNRLEIDESYAEMSRYNAKIKRDTTRRHRRDEKAEWVSFLRSAREIASIGPMEHFRIDLYHAHGSHSTPNSWNVFNY
jgi:hypothetical protein